MSTLSISRCFDVPATAESVWTYLTTPEFVVTCLPGAALTSSSEDGCTHEGTVTVKLGAMSIHYRGTAEFEDRDPEARKMRVRARGRERSGAGSAEMTMQASVVAQGPTSTQVALEASASVTGRVVTFGRGMIEIVAEQMLSDFASCLCEKLSVDGVESDYDAAAPGAPAPEPAAGLTILWRALASWIGKLLGRG